MPCYKPLKAFRDAHGGVVFVERGDIVSTLWLSCGQCVGCRLERSRQWAIRCIHEASLHKENCFITLTYDKEHCPADYSLKYEHFQLFMRYLRRKLGKVRFYMCGEYGEDFGRPHFHACLFGVDFPDKVQIRNPSGGSKLYSSEILSQLWGKGLRPLVR